MTSTPATEALPILGGPARSVDVESLKALGHPVRVAILDALGQFGPQTSSTLAQRLGGTSGSYSYHLRQLAKYGFIRELPERGTARDRWWERVPGGLAVNPWAFEANTGGREAANVIVREWNRNRAQLLADFEQRGEQELDRPWLRPSQLESTNVQVNAGDFAKISRELAHAVDQILAPYRNRELGPGMRAVEVQLNVFPILDRLAAAGTETGTEDPSSITEDTTALEGETP